MPEVGGVDDVDDGDDVAAPAPFAVQRKRDGDEAEGQDDPDDTQDRCQQTVALEETAARFDSARDRRGIAGADGVVGEGPADVFDAVGEVADLRGRVGDLLHGQGDRPGGAVIARALVAERRTRTPGRPAGR